MIYLDNAATTLLKPEQVYACSDDILRNYSANAGRGGHYASLKASEIIYSARNTIAEFLNIKKCENVIFTFGCTDSLNLVINGLFKKGDHILTTVYEHNSVLRPLENLKVSGINYTIMQPDKNGFITEKILKDNLKPNTKALIVNYVSNVTGIKQDMRLISKFKNEHDLLLIVDGAQAVGTQDLDFDYDFICCAGHKGLYGPQGIGILGINTDILPKPIRFGGTGTMTFDLNQPKDLPEYLESGTFSVQNIASLEAGIKFVLKNQKKILNHEIALAQTLRNELTKIKNVTIYSPEKVESGVIAFNIYDIDSITVADILDKKYKICVRGGFHCAPLLHKYLKTENTGAVRVSVSIFNTMEEIFYLVTAIKEIIKNQGA